MTGNSRNLSSLSNLPTDPSKPHAWLPGMGWVALSPVSEHFRGVFATLAALQASVATPVAGDYAQVDGGTGADITTYIYDVNDTKWVASGSSAMAYLPLAGGIMTGPIQYATATVPLPGSGVWDLGTVAAEVVFITNPSPNTGLRSITGFGTSPLGTRRRLIPQNLTSTPRKYLSNSTGGIVMPTGLTTMPFAQFVSIDVESMGDGTWKVVNALKADGTALVATNTWTGGSVLLPVDQPVGFAADITAPGAILAIPAYNTILLNSTNYLNTITGFSGGAIGMTRTCVVATGSSQLSLVGMGGYASIVLVTGDSFDVTQVSAGNYVVSNINLASRSVPGLIISRDALPEGGRGALTIGATSTLGGRAETAAIVIRSDGNILPDVNKTGGAVEYDGTDLFFTNQALVRKNLTAVMLETDGTDFYLTNGAGLRRKIAFV